MSLIDEHQLVKAADAKLAELARRREAFEANVRVLAEADVKAQAEFDKALDAAMRDGAPAPQPLVLQLNGADIGVRHDFMSEEQRLTEERLYAVAAAYPDVVAEVRSQATKLVAAARQPLEKLMAARTEIGDLLATVKTCRDAENAVNPNGRRQFLDSPLTVEELVRIVATGGDPVDILDLAGNRQARPRNIGMVDDNRASVRA